jgi:hypothetical protein
LETSCFKSCDFGGNKAKQQFFAYEQEAVWEDLRYIVDRYFPGADPARVKIPARATRRAQPQVLLRLRRYRFCGEPSQQDLERTAQRRARLSLQPICLLRAMLQHLRQERILAPACRTWQDRVGRVVSGERDRVSRLLDRELSRDTRGRFARTFLAKAGISLDSRR